ncbi:MFS transporter [Paraburkholderia sp.]|uniref:MFS transporter n=1 Tax=Paraburkholderia sp. TaxID=1926495 RepID=UPI0023930EED|nr:MFS transporter [Paraburkholderia sp.]MDE1180513.1 MFS transporter [Paraburkholderia sp.]
MQSRVESYPALIAYRLAIGFFDSAVWIGAAKLIVGWFPPEQRGRALGALLAAFSLAITLDFAIGIPLSASLGWRSFFALLGVGTLIVGVASVFLVRDVATQLGIAQFSWDDTTAVSSGARLRDIFRMKYFYIASLAIFGAMFGISATATWVVPAFITTQHMPPPSAALIGTVMGLSQVVFLIVGGFMSDHYAKRIAAMKVAALLSVIAAALLIVSAKIALPFSALIAISIFCGVVVAAGGAIFALISEKCGDALAGSAIGYAEMVGISSSFIAPPLLGGILQTTGSYAAAFWGFLLVEGLIFVVLMLCKNESRATHAAVTRHAVGAQPL